MTSSQTARGGEAQAKASAMGDILDRYRLDQGWGVFDDSTLVAMMQSYFAILDPEGVPHQAYGTLYNLFVGTRARARHAGKEPPGFGPDAMLAEWIGEHGLRSGWANHPHNTGPRQLSESAPTQCVRCHGTGMEQVFDSEGRSLGRRKGCEHKLPESTEIIGPDVIGSMRVEEDLDALGLMKQLQVLNAQDLVRAGDNAEAWKKAWDAGKVLSRVKRRIVELV